MKVGIIGSGMVGATSAYAIMMRKAASDIVLIDANEKELLQKRRILCTQFHLLQQQIFTPEVMKI